MHIDLVRAGQPTARLNQRAIAFLLLGRHLLIGNLGIASKRGCLGHGRSPGLKRAVGASRPVRASARDRRITEADVPPVKSIGHAVRPGKAGHRAWEVESSYTEDVREHDTPKMLFSRCCRRLCAHYRSMCARDDRYYH